MISRLLQRVDRTRLLAITGAVLIVGAVTIIGIAAASQQHPPQPTDRVAGSVGKRAPQTEPSGSTSRSTTTSPSTTAPAPTTTLPATLPRSDPIALSIPAIGVQSSIETLGLTVDGELQVPQPGQNYDKAAWCRCSPTPGERGPSVILGHVDSAESGPSVFYRLGALHPGDAVSVSRADGTTATFRVDGIRRFPKDAFPTELVYGNTPDSQLRLITCGGSFDDTSGHYTDNIVVFATLQSPGT